MSRIYRTALLSVLILTALALPYLHAADWPQFRGSGGQGIATEKGLPTTWSDTENMIWKTAMPGAGASSPIVLKDLVYLTCWSGYTFLYCIGAE